MQKKMSPQNFKTFSDLNNFVQRQYNIQVGASWYEEAEQVANTHPLGRGSEGYSKIRLKFFVI